MNGPTASSRPRLPAVPGSGAGRAGVAGAVLAAAVATALVISSPEADGGDGSSRTDGAGVRSAVRVGPPAQPAPAPALPLPRGSTATADARNPFLPPRPPPVEEPAAPPVPVGPPPGGRNPFEALVVPEPVPPAGTEPAGTGQADSGQADSGPADSGPAGPDSALLRLGSSGDDVRALQQRLRDRGWRIEVDGTFGPRTDAVIRDFQQRRGLAADGLVGPLTRSALG